MESFSSAVSSFCLIASPRLVFSKTTEAMKVTRKTIALIKRDGDVTCGNDVVVPIRQESHCLPRCETQTGKLSF